MKILIIEGLYWAFGNLVFGVWCLLFPLFSLSPLPLIPRGGPEFPSPQSLVPNPQEVTNARFDQIRFS
ncbi:UDP-Gal:betaGlcNAc beta 1,3-galactosyltransferase, polypeptide 4 [Tolypothrix sp. PCC 7601]|nr:UDP-Gal:betaGlcNAc beta 1,3-galactosyltransferase, polypeptide 4 [Tolypothrix sp. PCC 7601]